MWKFLGSVISSFLFLRDLFGYILPGAVFLALVHIHFHLAEAASPKSASQQQLPSAPTWLLIAALIVGCYVLGHILVALAYVFYDVLDKVRRSEKPPNKAELLYYHFLYPYDVLDKVRSSEEPQKTEAELLYYRYLYPQLFNERDRRSTLNILRIGLASALCFGSWFLPLWGPRLIGLVVGVFMIYNGYTGQKHVGDYGAFTLEAARKAEEKGIPPFRWDGCCDKKDSEKDE